MIGPEPSIMPASTTKKPPKPTALNKQEQEQVQVQEVNPATGKAKKKGKTLAEKVSQARYLAKPE